MLKLEENGLYIHNVIPSKYEYSFDKKLIDIISLASAPGIGSSNSIYRRIQRRTVYEKGYSLKKAERLKQFKMNGFDKHLFNASQQNEGILTQITIDSYAKNAFSSNEARKSFLDYTKMRLGYLSYLGLLNDTTEGNRFYEEKISLLYEDNHIEQRTCKMRVDYKYEVNSCFYEYYRIYLKEKRRKEVADFKFSNVHKFILKFCRNNEFRIDAYKQYMSKKLSGKTLEREIGWKRSSLEKLVRVGYLAKLDDNTYQLTEKGIQKLVEVKEAGKVKKLQKAKLEKEKALKEFTLGNGYKYLLKFAKDGILDYSDVEKRLARYNSEIRERETAIKKGMLNKLIVAGYLEPMDCEVIALDNRKSQYETGLFRLTKKAVDFIGSKNVDVKEIAPESAIIDDDKPSVFDGFLMLNNQAQDPVPETELMGKQLAVKITKFDLDNIVQPSKDGVFTKEMLAASSRKDSVEKRITTLSAIGLLVTCDEGWRLTGELLDRASVRKKLNIKREQTHSIRLDVDCLTIEQRKTVADIKDFLNLTGSQILKYIYNGNEVLYRSDIRYLLEKDILVKDSVYEVFVLTRKGTCLASDLMGDHNIFSSKIFSRREELKHDVLIYTAYKDMEKQLTDTGKAIISIKTDRVLRSKDMKEHNRMSKDYPDLRINYEDEKTGEKGFINIEVDVGYSEKVIAQKLRIPNLRWYTNRQSQKEKVLKKAKYMEVKIIDAEYWKRI